MVRSERASNVPVGGFVATVTVLSGAFMVVAGLWALFAPESFAQTVRFPGSSHFVADAGAFQLGIGSTLFAALRWREGLVVALLGFLVSNTAHVVNHFVDLHVGGRPWDPWLLGVLSVLTAAALVTRVRAIR